jgi:hypothetical protein
MTKFPHGRKELPLDAEQATATGITAALVAMESVNPVRTRVPDLNVSVRGRRC